MEQQPFDKIVSVSGLPGLYKIVANRNNGLIIEDLSGTKRRFVSVRQHEFSPLFSIGIFTDDGDALELKKVLRLMDEKAEETTIPDANAPTEELTDYLAAILPNYDRDQVYPKHIKKTIRWYRLLKEHNLIPEEEAETGEEE